MKHQAILITSTKCFYLCGGSLTKYFNNGIDKLQYPNMGITNLWSVEAIYHICRIFCSMKSSLSRKQTGFSQLYFHRSQVHCGKVTRVMYCYKSPIVAN